MSKFITIIQRFWTALLLLWLIWRSSVQFCSRLHLGWPRNTDGSSAFLLWLSLCSDQSSASSWDSCYWCHCWAGNWDWYRCSIMLFLLASFHWVSSECSISTSKQHFLNLSLFFLQPLLSPLTVSFGGSFCGLKVRFCGTTPFSTKVQTGEYPFCTQVRSQCALKYLLSTSPWLLSPSKPLLSFGTFTLLCPVLWVARCSSFLLASWIDAWHRCCYP